MTTDPKPPTPLEALLARCHFVNTRGILAQTVDQHVAHLAGDGHKEKDVRAAVKEAVASGKLVMVGKHLVVTPPPRRA